MGIEFAWLSATLTLLTWFCAIGCGLMAGVYFAFSAFIMSALDRVDDRHGMDAMNAINSGILRSPFMPLFFGTSVASALAAVLVLFHWQEPDSAATLVPAGLIYVVGMFGCTVAFNVPLNDALAKASGSPDATRVWSRYLKSWVRWNHVRTVASTAAMALYASAL